VRGGVGGGGAGSLRVTPRGHGRLRASQHGSALLYLQRSAK
jgi:hypothetical protein